MKCNTGIQPYSCKHHIISNHTATIDISSFKETVTLTQAS